MKFEDAVVKSIKAFLDGKMAEEFAKTNENGKLFYTPAYFDAYEQAIEDGDFDPEEEEMEDDAEDV